ncbi:hypothetical protein D3C75_816530 [compost metagenome]
MLIFELYKANAKRLARIFIQNLNVSVPSNIAATRNGMFGQHGVLCFCTNPGYKKHRPFRPFSEVSVMHIATVENVGEFSRGNQIFDRFLIRHADSGKDNLIRKMTPCFQRKQPRMDFDTLGLILIKRPIAEYFG